MTTPEQQPLEKTQFPTDAFEADPPDHDKPGPEPEKSDD